MAGKGDDQRPKQVSDAAVEENWQRTFGSTERRRDPAHRVELGDDASDCENCR